VTWFLLLLVFVVKMSLSVYRYIYRKSSQDQVAPLDFVQVVP
jgi:multisubunit Na+/H+ antiporter MnhF subunit